MFSKNTYLNLFLLSFIFSILVNNFLQDFFLSFLWILFISLVYFEIIISNKNIKKYIILYLFILLWSTFWIYFSENKINTIENNKNYLEKYFLRKDVFNFEIKEIYKKEDSFNSYVVKILNINWDKALKNINWLIYIPSNYSFHKWDILKSDIQIQKIINKNLSYTNYLLSKNIYFSAYIYNLERIWKKPNFLTYLDDFRMIIIDIVDKIYPKNEWILLAWILLWARENVHKELNDAFNNSWTTHFIAVSWFNITILIIFLWFLFKFFPIVIRSILIIWFLIVFCLFVGLEASVVRAWIMWILWYIISISWRKSISISLVLISCFFMLLYNPFFINYDLSFQLSFLAVLWILYTNDLFSKILKKLPDFFSIKESFILTLSAMCFTLPIMIFDFWQVSILSPISNVLIAWTIPLIMLIWLISIIWYFIVPLLWNILWFFSYLLLKWDITIIQFFWNLDFFIIKSNFWTYSIYFKLIYFIILWFCIITLTQKKKLNN